MTTLKIADRDAVVTQVLTEVFKPRFEELAIVAQTQLRDWLDDMHPTFIAMLKNPKSLPYLATGNVRKFQFNDPDRFTMFAPKYGMLLGMPDAHHRSMEPKYKIVSDYDTVVPASVNSFIITSAPLIIEYRRAWSDYTAACTELRMLLNSYTTHERLTKDFPEYAKYLPAVPVKTCLPVVIVKEVRAKLSKLGVQV